MSGSYCTRLMADLGAEVIKAEPPVRRPHIRLRPPLRDGRSAYFAQLNAGKSSIALDFKQPAARKLIYELVPQCDVLVENYRPGVMQRLALDYETVAKLNPKLVYCSISGFGQEGILVGRYRRVCAGAARNLGLRHGEPRLSGRQCRASAEERNLHRRRSRWFDGIRSHSSRAVSDAQDRAGRLYRRIPARRHGRHAGLRVSGSAIPGRAPPAALSTHAGQRRLPARRSREPEQLRGVRRAASAIRNGSAMRASQPAAPASTTGPN